MSKPPAVPPAAKDRLAAGIARLRAATGTAEKRVMFRMCSKENLPFTVVYERTDPRERFRITSTERTVPADGGGAAQAARPPQRAQAGEFNAGEFDQQGTACPWCFDKRGGVYHATCDTNYCGGARSVRSDGADQFRCPTCRELFGLITATTVHGKAVAGGARAARVSNRLTSDPKTLLPRR